MNTAVDDQRISRTRLLEMLSDRFGAFEAIANSHQPRATVVLGLARHARDARPGESHGRCIHGSEQPLPVRCTDWQCEWSVRRPLLRPLCRYRA
jgi:hypothetical protein